MREQRVVTIGAIVTTLALLVTFVVLPGARRWQDRSARTRALHASADTLEALAAKETMLDSLLRDHERAGSATGRRVLRARSGALAASALQSFLQEAADASRVVVTRLDVTAPGDDAASAASAASATGDAAPVSAVPASLSAYGDVYGLAALLRALDRGGLVVDVTRLTVQQNSALRGAPDVVQVTLALRAPVTIE